MLTVVLKFYDLKEVESSNLNILIKDILKILVSNKTITATVCGIIIFLNSIIPSWVSPYKARNRLKKKFVERINRELLGDNPELHRITLFKETNYFCAVLKNYRNLVNHLFYENKWRWRLYLKWPKRGKYLMVNTRYGLQYEKSSTMFRIELNEPKLCCGIAGYIRYRQTSMHVADLPNINDINFKSIRTPEEVKKNKRKDVEDYMEGGFIDFNSLRKMHRKAKHFYGTIITKKDGYPWGVLLVDSISDKDPFTPEVKKRFNSFATSISDIINMEV